MTNEEMMKQKSIQMVDLCKERGEQDGATDGKVNYHRDYWDTGEELYMKLPAIGTLMRGLRRVLAA